METINWQEPKKRFTKNAKPRDLMIGGEIMHRRRIQDRNIKIGFAILLISGITLLYLFTNQ